MKETIIDINKTKSCFFEMRKIDKTLVRHNKKKERCIKLIKLEMKKERLQ